MGVIELRRWYLPDQTLSRFLFDGLERFAIERRWNDNTPYDASNPEQTSCIPEGVYQLNWRRSGVVERSTGGEFLWGWEVANVPRRSFIMIHPGNTVRDVVGCIAPGNAIGSVHSSVAVLNSRAVFREFMARVTPDREWVINITTEVAPWARPK